MLNDIRSFRNNINNLKNKYDDEITCVIYHNSENPTFSETFMKNLERIKSTYYMIQ